MANFSALYDACVLYPAPLRDLLMHLAITDLFRAKWTGMIHDEWIRNVLANRADLDRSALERTRELMDQNVRDCLVHGYEPIIETLELPDPDDRHVLAAAIVGRADVIVTFNLNDFPAGSVSQFGIEAQHPDDFIHHLIDLDEVKVCAAAKRHRASLKNPPKTIEEYIATLEQQGLPQTANKLRELAEFL